MSIILIFICLTRTQAKPSSRQSHCETVSGASYIAFVTRAAYCLAIIVAEVASAAVDIVPAVAHIVAEPVVVVGAAVDTGVAAHLLDRFPVVVWELDNPAGTVGSQVVPDREEVADKVDTRVADWS